MTEEKTTKAEKNLDEAPNSDITKYNPREDPGPPRPEDQVEPKEGFKPAKLSAEEVDPEESRKDDSTVLAMDIFDSEGNRIN